MPVGLSFVTLSICLMLAYSDHYRGRWIFVITPAIGLRGFLRGVYWSIWLPFLALPFGVAMIIFTPRWGLADAALFAGYGLAVASLLFGLQLLLVEALPFTSAPKAERSDHALAVHPVRSRRGRYRLGGPGRNSSSAAD